MTTNEDEITNLASIERMDLDVEVTQFSRPLLLLSSHAYKPPLQPQPTLKYDLRGVPNPPKGIRDNYTGLDKRLRSHMITQVEFCNLLTRVEKEILEAMTCMEEVTGIRDQNRDDGLSSGAEGKKINLNDRVLSVGCYCERGRHRSVALIEELGRRKWPKDWTVRVVHRDVHNSSRSTERQKESKRKPQLKESYLEEE